MKHLLTGTAALLMTTSMAAAVGLDRSNQDVTAIFEDGNYAELSFGKVMPSVSGEGLFTGAPYDDVASDFMQVGGSIKMDINPQLSFAIIYDQPFGVDVTYPGSPAATELGGTSAFLESDAFTAIARYKINENFSVHAGVRRETLAGDITLSGLAYGGLNGYNVVLEDSVGTGYVVGAAYEIPAIAFRLAVTYNSAIDHTFGTTETVGGVPVNLLNPLLPATSETEVSTPEAINIDFQTGIAEDTLLFANVRYAKYTQTIVSPQFFNAATGGGSLTDIDDGTSYNVGVGRRFSDEFSASVSVGYEAAGDELVSPLSPTNGNYSLALGGQYTMGDIVLSGGARYTWVGDAMPETADTARADFADNNVLAVGLSVGFRF